MTKLNHNAHLQPSPVVIPWIRSEILRLALLAAGYWLVVQIGLVFVVHPEGVASLWPASGFALAVLLISPKRQWPRLLAVIFVTNAAGNWYGGNSLLVSLGFALANAAEAFLSAWVLIFLCKSRPIFERSGEVFALLGVAVFMNGLTALLGAAIPALAFDAPFFSAWRVWWVANGLGMMLVTPLMVTWVTSSNPARFTSSRQLFEGVSVIFVLALLAWLLFGPFTAAEKPLLRSYMLFPILVWLAFRFSPRGMTSGLLLLTVMAVGFTLHGYGIFSLASQTPIQHLVSLQVFLGVAVFSGLLASTLVAEYNRNAAALKAAEFNYRAIFENAPVGFFQSTPDGRYLSVNPRMARICGFESPAEMLSSISDIAHQIHADPAKRDEFKNLLAEQGQIFEFVNQNRRRDGSLIWTATDARVVRDQSGQILYYEGFLQDITARKQADEMLRESETRFHALFDRAPMGYQSLDEEGRFIEVNQAWLETLGYNLEEVKGKWFGDFLVPEYADAFRERFPIFKASGAIHSEFQMLHKNGNRRYIAFEGRVGHEPDGSFKQTHCILSDITSRKQAEDALRESESTLRAFFNAINDSLLLIELDGTVISANDTAVSRLNVRKIDLLGRSIYDFIPEKNAVSRRKHVEQVIATAHPVRFEDERSGFWLENSIYPVLDEHGRVQRLAIFGHEITERKQAEQILVTRLQLREFALSHSLTELLQKALDEAEALTDSQVGFFHFVDSDQKTLTLQAWSSNTLQNMCRAVGPDLHYSIDQAGVWVDCVHQRQAVIHNDYASLPHRKGMPEGHAPVIRELAVPVFRQDRIVAIFGVGNKVQNYDEKDVQAVSRLADLVWDITERKQIDDALRESEERYRRLTAAITDYVYTVRVEQGRAMETRHSAGCQAVTGYTVDELDADPYLWYRMIWPEDRQRVKDQIDLLLTERETPAIEHRITRKDGALRWIRDTLSAHFNERQEMVSYDGLIQDITERKQAEAALRLSEQNLKKAQHFAHLGSWTWEIQTNHIEWSDEMYNIFDIDKETFSGSLPDVISRAIHPDDRAKVDASNSSVIHESKPIPLDYRIIRSDGSVRVVWAEAGELALDETGQPSFLSGIVQDITERNQMEEKLRASLAEKEVLLKEVHHRVKNNLQVISSLLGMQAANSQNDQVIQALEESKNRVRAMALIHEKLYRSKNLEYIQAEEYISELLDHLASTFAGQMKAVTFDLKIENLTFNIERAIPCGMIINELVSNALKYAFPQREPGLIKVHLELEDGCVRLMVSDNGVGLPADIDIQQPETLGLELVSILSHQLKAKLEFASRPGTTFVITFAN